nr:dynein light chain LC8-type [Cryptococcus depauperatus CBS 7855]
MEQENSPIAGGTSSSGSRFPRLGPDGQPLKAVIKNVDMSEEMQLKVVETVFASFEKYDQEKDMAMYIKKRFDQMYGTTWHCVVGKNFGSFVTHGTERLH